MSDHITVRSVMSNFPYSIDIDSHTNSAKAMLSQLQIHHLPVKEGETPVGIITTRDIKRANYQGVDLSVGSESRVRDVYTPDTYIVSPDDALDTVLRRMADEHVDAAMVVENGKLTGIFTLTDACRRYADMLIEAGNST